MRKHLNFAHEQDTPVELKSGGAVADPSQREGLSPEDDVSDLDHVCSQFEAAAASLEAQFLQVEEAVDVADTLTQLAKVAQEELTEPAARILHIATESLLARVGDEGLGAAALETDTALLENGAAKNESQGLAGKITDKVKKIWQAIIEAIKKAWAWLKGIYRRFFDMAGMIKAKAEATKKALVELDKKGVKTSINAFTHPRSWTIVSRLRVEYKFPDNMAQAAQKTNKAIAAQLGRFKAEDLYNGKFIDMVVAGKPDQISYDPENEKRVSQLTKKAGSGGTIHGQDWRSDGLLGSQWIEQFIGHKACTGTEAMFLLRETPSLVHEESKPHHVNPMEPKVGYHINWGDDKELPVIPLRQAVEVCEEAIEMADAVLKFRDVQDKLESLGAKMIKAAEKMLKPNEAAVELKAVHMTPDWERAKRDFLAAGPRIFAHEPARIVNYALTTAAALNGYCGELAKIYSGHKSYAKVETKADSA